MIAVKPQPSETSLNYEYGEAQAGIILFVLIVSFTSKYASDKMFW